MKHRQITYVRMIADGWHHHHITHVGTDSATWREMTADKVIESIETGQCIFTVQDILTTLVLHVAKPNPLNRQTWYLRTKLIESSSDALLALPRRYEHEAPDEVELEESVVA